MDDMTKTDLIELTAEIISAYVSNNTVVASDLPAIIADRLHSGAINWRKLNRPPASRSSAASVGFPGATARRLLLMKG